MTTVNIVCCYGVLIFHGRLGVCASSVNRWKNYIEHAKISELFYLFEIDLSETWGVPLEQEGIPLNHIWNRIDFGEGQYHSWG